MRKVLLCALGISAFTSTAHAGHLDNLDTPYASRGACESAVAGFNSDVRSDLLTAFPNFFDSNGDVSSFLTRAFSCELADDENWYISDNRFEVLTSDWYTRRH